MLLRGRVWSWEEKAAEETRKRADGRSRQRCWVARQGQAPDGKSLEVETVWLADPEAAQRVRMARDEHRGKFVRVRGRLRDVKWVCCGWWVGRSWGMIFFFFFAWKTCCRQPAEPPPSPPSHDLTIILFLFSGRVFRLLKRR